MANSAQSKDLKIGCKNSFFVSQKKLKSRQKQKKNNFFISKINKTDGEDFEKLFIQPHSLVNVVNLNLYGKLQKTRKQRKTNDEERKKQN